MLVSGFGDHADSCSHFGYAGSVRPADEVTYELAADGVYAIPGDSGDHGPAGRFVGADGFQSAVEMAQSENRPGRPSACGMTTSSWL